MKPLPLFRLVLLLLAVGLSPARAEFVEFSYQWSVSPTAVLLGTNPSNITGNGLSSGSVAVALAAPGTASAELGGGGITVPLATVTTTGSAPEEAPDSFATPFKILLDLKDTATGEAASLTFSGSVNGKLTATSSMLTLDFADPLTQHVQLGAREFAVTVGVPSRVLAAPGSGLANDLVATVQLLTERDPTGPVVTDSPAPSALVLLLCACPALLRARRRG